MKKKSKLKKGIIALGCLLLVTAVSAKIGLFRITDTTGTNKDLSRMVIGGYPFYTEVYGNVNNPPVVVVHGGPGGDFEYLKELKQLEDQYYILFYDQRGTGRSARGDNFNFTIDSSLEDLKNIIKMHSHGKKTILIGHSWGGMLAAAYISKFPNDIEGAVIMEPGMLNPKTAKIFISQIKKAQENISISQILEISQVFLKSIFIINKDGHEMKDYILTNMMGMGKGKPYQCEGESLPRNSFLRAGYSVFDKMIMPLMDNPEKFTYDLTDGINSFQGRILLLSSECSFIGYEYQKKYHENLFPKAATHLMIKGTGHNMITLKPEESINIIRNFLKNASATRE